MTGEEQSALRGLWPYVAAALLLVAFGLGVEHFNAMARFRHYVGTEAVPQTVASLGRSGKALKLLEYKPLLGTRLEGYGEDILPEEMPSTTAVDAEIVQKGMPIVSVVVDSEDLLDPDHGIVVNYNKRGRSWERPGYATFFKDAQIQLATGAGVRVHGGKSRSMTNKSFQLRFRGLYGEGKVPLGLIDGQSEYGIDSLVIHNSLSSNSSQTFHYVNPVAYEIAERIGCIVPRWTPVQFYLNGAYQGPYVLTERINKDFFEAHYGHDDFVIFDTRSSDLKRGSRGDVRELLSWLDPDNVSANMAEMNEKVDLESLTNWYLSVMYGGTTDTFQGYAARDQTRADARWFWVNWDMDHSFVDFYTQAEHPWEVDTFGGRGHLLGNRPDARVVIFRKLITESEDYRKYFFARLSKVLNHDLNQQYMSGLIERYRETAASLGFERTYLLDILEDFALNRPAVLREQVDRYLSAGPSYLLTVRATPEASLLVDGRSVGETYEGWYFESTPAQIELYETADAAKFQWLVNGEPMSADERVLSLALKSDTTVELVPIG